MDEILDLSAKSSNKQVTDVNCDSTPNEIKAQPSLSTNEEIEEDAHQSDSLNIPNSTTLGRFFEKPHHSTPPTHPSILPTHHLTAPTHNSTLPTQPMFYQGYPGYSLLANPYFAVQQQMMSQWLMANQMCSSNSWPSQNNRFNDSIVDYSAFYQKFINSRHISMPQIQTNPIESHSPNEFREETNSKHSRRASEKTLKRPLQSDEVSSDKSQRKKVRVRHSDNVSTPRNVSPENSLLPDTISEKQRKETNVGKELNTTQTLGWEDSNSRESKCDPDDERRPMLESEYSSESQSSEKSGNDSLSGSVDQINEDQDMRLKQGTTSNGHDEYNSLGRLAEDGATGPRASNYLEYRERRRKNNAAAKRSRDQRRHQEESINGWANNLKEENIRLKTQLAQLKMRSSELEKFLRHKKTPRTP